MRPLAEAGYHVVAPDQRGYGKTTSVDRSSSGPITYDEDLAPYRMFNLARDIVALVFALGYENVDAVVGHDFGSAVAGFCALIRPDLFKRVVVMSAPFTGAPSYPLGETASAMSLATFIGLIRQGLAALQPPRKHYMLYFSTPQANLDMHTNVPTTEALHAFLRAYYHVKSADWAPNDPHPLPSPTPSAISVMPEYYIMGMDRTMPESVLPYAPSPSEVQGNAWLPDEELAVCVSEFQRTGFQGGLNWYRCMSDESERLPADLLMFSGKKVEVPAMFIAGEKDWGVWQQPGAAEKMKAVCGLSDDRFILVEGAGHWVQQEKPGAVVDHILAFLKST
ncbi:alpha/beta-hydrolase [Artomyces pyxidatus]|uniref:Alpha/beta-hydrolase n=1 Tax=Artomyces pyxidatus TaxID=48021 RepID=A0ACB8TEG4_9AGAM|nr:alpha/beta-hydrolase [Artomyces pyxidatus]